MQNKDDDFDLSQFGATLAKPKKNQPAQDDDFDLSQFGAVRAENKAQKANVNQTSPLQAEGQYLKGLGKGALQQLGKYGVSALNYPSDVYEHFAGEPLYEHFNNPYQASAPQSPAEASGQRMGPGAAELAALAPPLMAAGMVPKAIEGASLIPRMIHAGAKIGTAGSAGYLEGQLIGEPNREEEAKKLGMESAGGEAIGLTIGKIFNSMPSKKIAEAEKNFYASQMRHDENKALLAQSQGQGAVNTRVKDVERYLPTIEKRNDDIRNAISTLSDLPNEPFPSMVTHLAYKQLPVIAEDNLAGINNKISEFMGKGDNPDKPLAKAIVRYFEGIDAPSNTQKLGGLKQKVGGLKQEIGEEFNVVRRGLDGKTFTLPANIGDSEEYELAKHTAQSMVGKKGAATPEEVEKLTKDILNKMGGSKGKTVDAGAYFDRYRSLDKEISNETYYLRRNEGLLTTDQSNAQKQKIIDMQTKLNAMEDLISSQSKQYNPDLSEQLAKAKFRWGTEYAPLRSDPTYRQMIKKNTVDGDLMEKIHGDDPASLILRNHFQTNPDAAEKLASYQFASNPEALQNLTKYEKEFINPKLTPNIITLMNEQKVGTENVMRAKSQEAHFDDVMKNVQSEQKRHYEQLQERQKLERQIPQWEKEIADLEKHEKIIRERMKDVKLSKAEIEANKSKLQEIKAKSGNIRRRLAKTAGYGIFAEIIKQRGKNS